VTEPYSRQTKTQITLSYGVLQPHYPCKGLILQVKYGEKPRVTPEAS
jgi:hypothetical protein